MRGRGAQWSRRRAHVCRDFSECGDHGPAYADHGWDRSHLRAGAGGYIVKDAEPEDIIEALHQVLDGAAPLSPAVAHQLMVSVKNDPAQVRAALRRFPATPAIPSRELEGLHLLASGCSNSETARHMMVSEATVKVYMGRLVQRLQVRDRVQLLIRAVELGLVEPALP